MNKFLLFFMAIFILSPLQLWAFGQHSETEILDPNPLRIKSVTFSPQALSQGSHGELIVEVELAEHHHAYVEQFHISTALPVDTQPLKVIPTVIFYDHFSKREREGIRGEATIRTLVELHSDFPLHQQNFTFGLTYQACTKEYCLFPIELPSSVKINVLPMEHDFSNAQVKSSLNIERWWIYAAIGGLLFLFALGSAVIFRQSGN